MQYGVPQGSVKDILFFSLHYQTRQHVIGIHNFGFKIILIPVMMIIIM